MEITRTIVLQFACLSLLAGISACAEDVYIDDLNQRPGTGTDSEDTGSTPQDSGGTYFCDSFATDNEVASSAMDFIVAVDNSAGMEEEILMLQNELPHFVDGLQKSGVAVHVTLITGPDPAEDKKKTGMCMPTPLGSGNCPEDSMLPVFLHIPEPIASKDALTIIHSTSASWIPGLRDDSQIHIMVVSDDNADVEAEAFTELMVSLSPQLERFYFHTISASQDKATACESDPPQACCETAAKTGDVYQTLAQTTGGISRDLCAQNFKNAFDDISAFVLSNLCAADTASDQTTIE